MCGHEGTTGNGSLGGRGTPDGALVPVTAGTAPVPAPALLQTPPFQAFQGVASSTAVGDATNVPPAPSLAILASAGTFTAATAGDTAGLLAQAPTAAGATAPLPVSLAAAPASEAGPGPSGTLGGVAVTPGEVEVLPSPAGPVGEAKLTLTNLEMDGQVVWISGDTPDLIELALGPALTQPQSVTLLVRVDLAQAAGLGAAAPGGANVYVTTATGTRTVRVSWKPLPYGSM